VYLQILSIPTLQSIHSKVSKRRYFFPLTDFRIIASLTPANSLIVISWLKGDWFSHIRLV
jgi:hypothetical protein